MRPWLVVLVLLTSGVAACDRGAGKPSASPAEVPAVSVPELAKRLGDRHARPVDANGGKLRQDVGVIPGAILLSDYETFTAAELPADRAEPLVFYCANEQCGASDEAAKKARVMGYANVSVLPAGILGWAKSGQRVDKL